MDGRPDRHEQGGCCLSASLHDFARFGQFILDGAKVNGRSIVPTDGSMPRRTSRRRRAARAGYGYQWWTTDDGTFDAIASMARTSTSTKRHLRDRGQQRMAGATAAASAGGARSSGRYGCDRR